MVKKEFIFERYVTPCIVCYWMESEDCIASSANTNEGLTEDEDSFGSGGNIEEWDQYGDKIIW